MKFQKLSVVIPAYNEERTIVQLLEKVVEADLGDIAKEIFVINDCSKDSTSKLANDYAKKINGKLKGVQIQVVDNSENLKKSRSVQKGILLSTGDLVVVQDADLEYEPQDLREFITEFESGDLDVIYGNRFGKKNKVVYWQNYFGNLLLTFISNVFTFRHGFRVSDMEVCYKMVRGDILRELMRDLESINNFGVEPETTAKLAKYRKPDGSKLKFAEIAVNYYPRTIAEGKHMKAFQDGMKALKEIIKFNLK